ncbi:MAG: iron chelate uptake ABC transporter family permease subunit [Bacillota bacterium]|nr:iron chelate uptake ABC transporter family permease subunit [Bacillota bacterium]
MFNLDLLGSYAFLVVALGTMILAMASGAVGCITVMKGQSLIGDAIGHAAFPGIILAFMFSASREPVILLVGAMLTGTLCFIVIQLIHTRSKLDLDASLAIALSSFFGAGMMFKSYIQGNPKFSGASQSGLQNYIFGQAAYMMNQDIFLILAVAVPALILLVVFFKEIKVFIFDEVYAKTIGLNTKFIYFLMLIMTMSLISVGLKLVGAILISSLLIVPCITAVQWSNKFHLVLLISAVVGGVSALIGTYISTISNGMSTGPTIIMVMSSFAFLSLLIGPHGILANMKMRRKYK